MPTDSDHLWGIILAAGEGKRLKKYIRSRFNSDCPKQYCVFTGTRSMLSHTIARAKQFIPTERIIVTINSEHRVYAKRDIEKFESQNVVVQPFNRETSASIILPLLHVARRDPEAIVVILPSDHFILEEERFMQHMAAAADFVERHPKYLLLLGVESEQPRTDYGWIETSMKIADVRGCEIYRVKRFLEKPSAQKASSLQKNRSLLNTMVMVGEAATILKKIRRVTPSVFHAFKRINAELFSPHETATVKEVYATLPSIDFSVAILQHDPRGLAVLHVKDVYWNDWGDAARIQTDIARLENEVVK